MIHDRVTTLGTGVDGAVRRLSATFDVRGLVAKLTSHSNPTVGSGVIVNDVGLAYNSFGQVISDAQSHNLGVSGTTPKVQYSYANGSTNTIRPTTLTYPNGRALTIGYGTSGGINDAASRVDGLIDGATTLVNYAYLGLGTTVQTTYPQPVLQYTLIGVSGGTSPAGDIYWGLDQFGRIIDSHWCKTTAGNAVIDRIMYGYDRASNRIWRQNPVATAASTKFDEFYTNDGLQRLKDMQRGTLNGTNTAITSPTFSQCWTLDPTGNWRGFNESTTGSTWTLTQARTSNTVNEITGITNSVGGAWTAPAYDLAGNMTTMPRPGTPSSSYTAVYDAWNRLVSIKAGTVDVQQYQYDARNFRTVILSYTSGVLSETRHSYFTSNWRCIEERTGTSTSAERPFVWGARYIDDCVLRDRDTTGGGTLNDRKYALQDANWNMSALTVSNGLVGERYAYTPYGKPIFLSAAFVPRSTSSYAWEVLYCGYRYDAGTQLYSVRYRSYHPVLGSWCQRDPIGYVAGMNLTRFASSSPLNSFDPFGLMEVDLAWRTKKEKEIRNHCKPEYLDKVLQNRFFGCIGYVCGELGIPYSHNFGERPDLTNCYKSLKEAQDAQAKTKCPGNSIYGKRARARIINLQFHDTKYENGKVKSRMTFTPGDGGRYNLEKTPGHSGKDQFTDDMSLQGTGYFVSNEDRFRNYDFSLLIDSAGEGKWIHADGENKPAKYSTTADLERQFKRNGPEDNAKDLTPQEQLGGRDKQYAFNQQFFCVVCEKQWEKGVPK